MDYDSLMCTNYRFEVDVYGPQYYARRVCLQERLDVCIWHFVKRLARWGWITKVKFQ